ncbi:MAG: hypothetical protein U0694_26245 [Anaerolineae bacterium]
MGMTGVWSGTQQPRTPAGRSASFAAPAVEQAEAPTRRCALLLDEVELGGLIQITMPLETRENVL